MLACMLLLPDSFQPANRTSHHNSCIHKNLDSREVKVGRWYQPTAQLLEDCLMLFVRHPVDQVL